MSSNYWCCVILFRVILPCLITIAFFRPTFSSYVYLLMGFYLPFFSVPTYSNMAGSTGNYMKLLIIVSILIPSYIISFYFTLFFPDGSDYDMEPCSTIEQVLRTVGVVEYRNLPIKDLIIWCLPEPLMLVISMLFYVIAKKLTKNTAASDTDRVHDVMEDAYHSTEVNRKKLLAMLLNFGKYFIVLMFCLTAVIRPSGIAVIYYLIFLVVLTYWACNKSLGKAYARFLIALTPIIIIHMSMLFFYQMQYFQDIKDISPETFYGRLFQLVRLNTYKDCKDPRQFVFHQHSNATYALPYLLFLLYYLTVLVAREILQAKDGILAIIVAFFRREKQPDVDSMWKMAFTKIKQQIEDDELDTTDEEGFIDKIKALIEQAIQFIIRSSYLVANFIMMVWAIAYIGWKSMVLLIWANLIWLLPARREIMLHTSPFLVAYVWFLLGSTYFYSMDIRLPEKIGELDLAAGNHLGEELLWIHLLIKSLFSIIFFITMRQFFQERALKRGQRNLAEAIGIHTNEATLEFGLKYPKSKTWIKLEHIFRKWFALCWIWVVVITMIWMDFMSNSNPFRITFVGLAILFVMTLQIFPFNCWKKFMVFYWWIVITYAMFNLFVLYMYQLSHTRQFLHAFYDEDVFTRFGFDHESDPKRRFFIMANPLFLQIAIVVQKNYLQKDFDKFTSALSSEELEKEKKELEEIDPSMKKMIDAMTTAKNVFFCFLEVHLSKVILLVGWLLCCFDWCALFVPFAFLLTASCIFGRLVTLLTIYSMSLFVQLLILARLIYMNQYRDHHVWNYVGYYERNGRPYNVTLNTADWLGFHQSTDSNRADFWILSWCFLFVLTVTLDPVVRLRQLNYRKSQNLSTARQKVLFPQIDYRNCHDNASNMVKFLLNYGFYKFGIEFTAVVAVIVMAIRMDIVAIVIAVYMLFTFSLSRKSTTRMLMPVMIVAGIWIPLQYVMSLGLWPASWKYSRTPFWNENDFRVRFQQFCHIMNMAHPPPKKKILYDFVLLMCFSSQWRTFRALKRLRGQDIPAGSNRNVSDLIDVEGVENPVPDFVTYSRNILDVYKQLFFLSWFYLSLLVTFLAGTVRPALYSFGYILASFFLMWEGTDMFLRPPASILFRWNLLIWYNLTILTFRTISQIFGCILVYEWQDINCKIYTMFDVVCIDRFNMTGDVPNMNRNLPCKVHFDPVGLRWDCICFVFLIIQQRIYKSFHFFHIVNDSKAQAILGSTGAHLIEEQRQKKRQAFDSQHQFIKTNVQKKMQRIQENQKKIQGEVYLRRKKNHKHMLRSGDYYMFDNIEKSLDVPLLPPKKEEVDTEVDPYDPMPFDEYLEFFVTSGLERLLEERALRHRQKQAVLKGEKPEDSKKAVVLKNSKPGPSKDPDTASQAGDTSSVKNMMHIFLFSLGLMESIVVSLTAYFNSLTKDFRFILKEMDESKMLLKENTNYTKGVRIGAHKVWKPSQSYSDFLKSVKGKKTVEAKIHYTIYEKLLKSIWYLGVSQSEWLCYFVIVLNQVARSNFIALPLPMMVFCWGSLTIPKPTKTFWVISIAYALIMSLIKNFFVMNLVDWNKHTFSNNLFYPPTIIGLDRDINSVLNLSLLFSLFFHRVVLQWLGLWETFFYRKASLIKEGNYNLKDRKLIPLKENEAPIRGTMNVRTISMGVGDYFPKSLEHGAGKYAEGFRLFIQQLISSSSTQIPVDVYTPMLLCDIMNLFLIVFFYRYFESSETDQKGGFVQYVQDNRVPVTYICVIMGYSLMIVIDRWIYLRKNRFAKLVYHFFLVLSIHVWAFVLYPMVTRRLFNQTPVVQLFYVFKCIYFLFSAYQIRNGYPHLISSHCLTKGTNLYYRFAFKVYRMIPYLFELRSLLDWTCSDTSLEVSDWFKMEEINQCIFDQKCQQDYDTLVSEKSGEPKNRTTKYLVGGCLFTVLFLTIIFPFLIFSLGGSVGVRTHPAKLYLEVYLGSAEPIFKSYASQSGLIMLNENEYRNLTRTFNNIRTSEGLFGAFETEDVVVVKWSSHSLSSWMISPGGLKEMVDEVRNEENFYVRVVVRYTHVGAGGTKSDRVFGQNTFIPPLPDKARSDLLNMLVNSSSKNVVWLPLVFPKFLMITKEAKPRALPIMEEPRGEEKYNISEPLIQYDLDDDDDDEERNPKRLRNLLLSLQKEDGLLWWQIREECDADDENYIYYLKDLVYNSCTELVIYTFNEKVFSGTMNYVTGSGILGLYLIYFMVVFGVVRSCMIGVSEIWIEDLPNADRLFRKCKEVYVARDMHNYELEEELFSELIFIMRSREICIKLTRFEDDPYNPTYIIPGTRRQNS